MLGPHYQRLAEAERHITGKQMLERVQTHVDNPLTMVIDKLKRQFAEYQTVYSEDVINHQINSVDKLLSYDGKLGPILSALQKQNNLLRRQLSLFESQLSNSVSICEHLTTENNELKQALLQKNDDINKIIETIAKNESQNVNQLEDKVTLLQQENNILIKHMQQVKRKHQQYKISLQNKDDEIKKWERKWNETKKHLGQALERERDVTRKLAVSEHLLFQEKEKFDTLYNKFHQTQLLKTDLQKQIALIESARDTFDPEIMRKTIENEYIQIIEQHRAMKNQRQALLRQSQKNKFEKQKVSDAFNDIEKKFNKVLNQYELTNNLLGEQKSKNQTLITTLKKVQAKIDELKNQNIQLKMQSESNKGMNISKQRSLYSQIQQLRRQLDQKSANTSKILKQIQLKNHQLLDAKEAQIKRLTDQNAQYRRLFDRRG